MKKLFLDDIRIPKDCANGLVPSQLNKFYWEDNWIIVRSYNEFVKWILDNDLPEFISFDHDLADIHYTMDFSKDSNQQMTEKTGYDCAKWLANYCMEKNKLIPQYVVHSQNPIGKVNIQSYLENFKRFINK
jgi:hypothetical protein